MKKIFNLLVISCFICLSACGFHLRGSKPVANNLKIVYVDSENAYGFLTLRLKDALGSMHIQVTESAKQSPLILKIYDEKFSTSNLADSASSATKKYTLHYQVTYALFTDSGADVYGPKTLHVERNYLVNEDQVLSSTNETTVLQRELQNDVLYQLLHQLASPNVEQALTDVGIGHEVTS